MSDAQNDAVTKPQDAGNTGGWDDPAGAGVGVMRDATREATPRSVAVGIAHLPSALTDVQSDEFDAAVGLALSRMSSRADGELVNVRATVDQSNSVIVLTADVRRENAAADNEGTR